MEAEGVVNDTDKALRELERVSTMLVRMTTPKKFRKPDDKDRPYRKPVKPQSYGGMSFFCRHCGRQVFCGNRCRECYQKQVRAKYADKVVKDRERVAIAREALSKLERI